MCVHLYSNFTRPLKTSYSNNLSQIMSQLVTSELVLQAWSEMTDIINILIRCEFAYHVEFDLASSASTKLYYAMIA